MNYRDTFRGLFFFIILTVLSVNDKCRVPSTAGTGCSILVRQANNGEITGER